MVVLVLTQWFDPTADHVISELNSRNVRVFRFDAAEFPLRLSLSAELGGNGWDGVLRRGTTKVTLSEVTGIYHRRPQGFEFPAQMHESERRWAAAEARMGLGGVLSALGCWLNHPARIAAAEYKPGQLAVAVRAGLRVPRTILTNDPPRAAEFAQTAGKVIYKPLAGSSLAGSDELIYASVVGRAQLPDPSVRLTAHLFQEWIEHDYAVRMTVVDGRFFASSIHADSEAAHVDWRSDYSALRYAVADPPDTVRQGVMEMMRQLGLRFGALDFLVTPSGEWVFLEINPNGQWAWIEDQTGMPIAAAMADALSGSTR